MARTPRSKAQKAADATLGKRLAKLRKDRGFTQTELAEKMGIIQALISDYECGKLRPNPEILVKFAKSLAVSVDEILGLTPLKAKKPSTNRRFVRRLEAIGGLPKRDQDALLRTIDAYLSAEKAS